MHGAAEAVAGAELNGAGCAGGSGRNGERRRRSGNRKPGRGGCGRQAVDEGLAVGTSPASDQVVGGYGVILLAVAVVVAPADDVVEIGVVGRTGAKSVELRIHKRGRGRIAVGCLLVDQSHETSPARRGETGSSDAALA